MHIPACETNEMEIISFAEALENEKEGRSEERRVWERV